MNTKHSYLSIQTACILFPSGFENNVQIHHELGTALQSVILNYYMAEVHYRTEWDTAHSQTMDTFCACHVSLCSQCPKQFPCWIFSDFVLVTRLMFTPASIIVGYHDSIRLTVWPEFTHSHNNGGKVPTVANHRDGQV